jgi:hypothetical protein
MDLVWGCINCRSHTRTEQCVLCYRTVNPVRFRGGAPLFEKWGPRRSPNLSGGVSGGHGHKACFWRHASFLARAQCTLTGTVLHADGPKTQGTTQGRVNPACQLLTSHQGSFKHTQLAKCASGCLPTNGEAVQACISFESTKRSSFKHSACPVDAPGRGRMQQTLTRTDVAVGQMQTHTRAFSVLGDESEARSHWHGRWARAQVPNG